MKHNNNQKYYCNYYNQSCLLFPASAATLINIRNARKHFEKLERVDGPKHSLHMRMRWPARSPQWIFSANQSADRRRRVVVFQLPGTNEQPCTIVLCIFTFNHSYHGRNHTFFFGLISLQYLWTVMQSIEICLLTSHIKEKWNSCVNFGCHTLIFSNLIFR